MVFNKINWAELKSCMQVLEERPEIVSDNYMLCYLLIEPLKSFCDSVKLLLCCCFE